MTKPFDSVRPPANPVDLVYGFLTAQLEGLLEIVCDQLGMGFQDYDWWPEALALREKLATATPASDDAAVGKPARDDAEKAALRRELLAMMSDWSERAYAAGWMSHIEEMLYEQGGVWEILGRAVGWPTSHEHDPDFAWVTWDEAGAIFARRYEERKARRAAR